jgi:UDP-GlcNAc:undecaprenyl-phosphate GlcNAc-1-phosphate transferase
MFQFKIPFIGFLVLSPAITPLLTAVWVIVITNAVNLIDGLDGLAGGVVAIISLSMLGYATLQGSPGTIVLMAATAGACIGFLRHNWEPARIFMGDSGALTLGFLLAAMSVHSALKAPAALAIVVPILALGLPVMDTLLVMAVRFIQDPRARLLRRFLGMFHADREHLHHLLGHFGARRAHVVGLLYSVVLAFCGMALLVAVTGWTNLGVLLLILEFGVVFGMRQLGRATRPPGSSAGGGEARTEMREIAKKHPAAATQELHAVNRH